MFWLGNLGLIILLSSIEKQKYKNNKDKQSIFINKPHTKSWYYLFRSERKTIFMTLKTSNLCPNTMFAFEEILRITTEHLVRGHPRQSIIYLCNFSDKYPNSSVVKW